MRIPSLLSLPHTIPPPRSSQRTSGAPFVMRQLATSYVLHVIVYICHWAFAICPSISFLWERGSSSFPLSSGGRTRSSQSLLQHPPPLWPGSQRTGRCEWCRPRDGGELKAGVPDKWGFDSGHPWQRSFTKNGQVWLVGCWSGDREVSSGTYGQRREFLQSTAPHPPHVWMH